MKKLSFLISVFLFFTNIAIYGQAKNTLESYDSAESNMKYPLSNNDFILNCNPVNLLQFTIHSNFFLTPEVWGEAVPVNITNLLDNVISNFYVNLDTSNIRKRTVLVTNSKCRNPPTDTPQIISNGNFAYIFLATQNRAWAQYSYQFAHELCHYVIDTDFPPTIDKFGWFQESICELASFFTLERMATKWKTIPPYKNWSGYSQQLRLYVDQVLQSKENTISIPFGEWLGVNSKILYKNRTNRLLNRIVAVKLFSVFKKSPKLWTTVLYLKQVRVTQEMDFTSFLIKWKEKLPSNLINIFKNIEHALK